MKHISITSHSAYEIARARILTNPPLSSTLTNYSSDILSNHIAWVGIGNELDYAAFDRACELAADLIQNNHINGFEEDQIEGKIAIDFHKTITELEVPYTALSDPGFWTYLSLSTLWSFMIWRYKKAFSPSPEGEVSEDFHKYIDASKRQDSISLRMYLRITSLGDPSNHHLAYALTGSELWTRGVFYYSTIQAYPGIVKSMIKLQNDPSHKLLVGTELRLFLAELRRTLTNLAPDILNDEEADELVREHWLRQRN